MAVPTNATVPRFTPLKSGVMIGVSPSSDPTFDVEFARATSSGVYSTVARLTAKGAGVPVVFEDLLPVDGKVRNYKARAVKDGYQGGDYTAVLSVKPTYLPDAPPNVTPITGQKLGVNVFLSTAQKVAFGSAAVGSSYRKTIGLAATQFQPASPGVGYSHGIGTLVPTTAFPSTAVNYRATVPLPTGATVYKAQWIYGRLTTSAVFRAELYSVSTLGTATLQYGHTATVTGANLSLSSSSFSFTVANTYAISAVALKSTEVGGNKASLISFTLSYRIPNLQTGV